MQVRTLVLSACLLAGPAFDLSAAPGGSGPVSGMYSAVIAASTPERDPAYMLASGLALVLLSLASRRLFRGRKNNSE